MLDKSFTASHTTQRPAYSCTHLDALNSAATGFATRRRPRGRDVAQHEFGIRCGGDNGMHHEPVRHRSTRGVVPSYI